MDKEVVKEVRKCVTIVAVIALLIVYSENIIGSISGVLDVFTPFFAGLAIAFVLNIPMAIIEEKLLYKWNGNITGRVKRGVSMTASILIVLAVIFLVVFSIVPQLADTFRDIADRIPGFYEQVVDFGNQLTKDYPQINEIINEMGSKEQDWSGILSGVGSFMQSGTMGTIVSSTVNVASSIAVFLFKMIIAICFAVYLLVNKEKLLRHVKLVFETYLPKKWFKFIHDATIVLSDTFKKFIAGQCLEAIILGLIFAVCMALFRIPYVLLISVLIAFTALIPVAGAFIGCAVGAFLILIVSPIKMIQFLILFIIIQQIENKLIYPRIVGSSVGLPAIWVFVAVTVGGSISGVFGMIVFIPLASTMYILLRDDIRRRRSAIMHSTCEVEEENIESAEYMEETSLVECIDDESITIESETLIVCDEAFENTVEENVNAPNSNTEEKSNRDDQNKDKIQNRNNNLNTSNNKNGNNNLNIINNQNNNKNRSHKRRNNKKKSR